MPAAISRVRPHVRSGSAVAVVALALALVSCAGAGEGEGAVVAPAAPLPTVARRAAAEPPKPAPSHDPAPPPVAAAKTCAHRRPFTGGDAAPGPSLPAPFSAFTPCDALRALFPDYDAEKGASPSLGASVRLDAAHAWVAGDRSVLALVYYTGADADADFVCGSCYVDAHVAVVERSGDELVLVVKGPDPWHTDDSIALFDGTAEFSDDPAIEHESLLGVVVHWSHGMIGGRGVLMLYALDGERLHVVFEEDSYWHASGMGKEDDDHVDTRVRFLPRAGAAPDLELTSTERRCHIDPSSDDMKDVCGAGRVVGTSRYRASADGYHRASGGPMPLPGALHRIWGW
jgi:hypothetical protein